jgi:hypothetical protein
MEIKVLEKQVNASELKKFAENWYLDFLKGCVDLVNGKVAVGGDYHMESCELLTSLGGHHKDVWGFNIRYLDNDSCQIEFDSLVNIKPNVNRGRVVEDEETRKQIEDLVRKFITF